MSRDTEDIQAEVFDAVNETLHSMVTLVDREEDDPCHQRFLCVTGTVDDFPPIFKIHTVVKTACGFKSKQDWSLTGLKSVNYISRDSKDFELEWDKLYHWTSGSVKEKEALFDILYRICLPHSSPPNFLNYPDSKGEASGLPNLDEPLDMSLKSRKRSHGNESNPKKKRGSVISYAADRERDHSSRPSSRHAAAVEQLPRTSHILNDLLTKNKERGGTKSKEQTEEVPSRIIISNDVDGGLEEHFRRSLCKEFYTNVDSEGVDEHFSRSLGQAKWKEIQRSAKLKLKDVGKGKISTTVSSTGGGTTISPKSSVAKPKPKT